jgi:hypothetical protein
MQAARSIDRPQARALSRSLIVAVPLVALLLALLASADAVYGHLLASVIGLAPLDVPRHVLVTVAVALGFATLVAFAAVDRSQPERGLRRRLAPLEWKVLLGAVDLVFLSFILVQATVLFGGRAHLLSEAGLTAAEYARNGFFQLLAVAAITTGLLAVMASWGRRQRERDDRTFAVLAGTMIFLTLATLASSFQRLALYEAAFGFTRLRLAVHTTILVLAAVLACGVTAVMLRRANWLPAAVVTIGLVAVVALNLLNPDAFIARHNLERASQGESLDVALLTTLSSDAAPVLVEALPSLAASEATALRGWLACGRDSLAHDADRTGWLAFNAARDQALRELTSANLGVCDA